MAETGIVIHGPAGALQGLFEDAPGDRAVVVTHPHPLYGGSMANNVVEAVIRAYRQAGYATLRFNFRGVGGSEGAYGEGIGEQEDVLAALDDLGARGKSRVDLAGYSFGAWVNAMGLERFSAAGRLIMVSPPVAFLDFAFLRTNPKIRLIIAGSADDIAPPGLIRQRLSSWNPEAELAVIQGADHFYWGREQAIADRISRFLRAGEGSVLGERRGA